MAKTYPTPAGFSDKQYSPIAMTPVQSNQVAAVGYDAATKTLAVTFTRGPGHIYHYPNVEEKTHQEFMAAESKGTFFGKHIKALPFEKFHAQNKAAEA
ncbi:KTSC domain-containing protein [Hydrogenophaga pseudoflava]|uniref:KTSC domain-containing protein n=1 Tax=Hydrogenophaga pseudoflava TaxID=47421 RepID=UPI0027E5AA20|nr:KTSC domain-containing protein [Hydrogenophaga pseudoflava]MDQ7745413.1 KTSC domain-containing protein [Hydrogenophaga pseudoflava]